MTIPMIEDDEQSYCVYGVENDDKDVVTDEDDNHDDDDER